MDKGATSLLLILTSFFLTFCFEMPLKTKNQNFDGFFPQFPVSNNLEYQEAIRSLHRRLQSLSARISNKNRDPLGLEDPNPWPDEAIFNYQFPHGWHFIHPRATTDGIYDVSINGKSENGYCQFTNDGNAWLVFQRRQDGNTDFYRDWLTYEKGFGEKFGEYWMGLKKLHSITQVGAYSLRVDLEDFDGNVAHAEYNSFAIGTPAESYPIFVRGFSGTAGDSLSYHNGYPFSTKDRDNAYHYRRRSCAVDSHGAWWYNSCQHSNLNGEYLPKGTRSIRGIIWYHWKFNLFTLRKVSMKIRPN